MTSMSPIEPSLRVRPMLDDAVLAYVQWREECAAVWNAYRWWESATTEDAVGAHAAYRAALDREEAAATVYAKLIDRIGYLAEPGSDKQLQARRSA